MNKPDRMAIRRRVGNRVVHPLPRPTPPKGPAYLNPFVCLSCRKSFKRKADAERSNKTCPACGAVMYFASRKFKPPKSTDLDQWKKIELLLLHGFVFDPVYDDGRRVKYPETLKQAREFVRVYSPHYSSATRSNRRIQ